MEIGREVAISYTISKDVAPPRQLQALINSVAAGCGLHLYIPN